MAALKAGTRKAMPKKDFAGPGRSFPIEDKKHARLAIGGATRSERAGNISEATEAKIKSAARAKLKSSPRAGATDGMGGGTGGMAVHGSAKGTNMHSDRPMRHEAY